MDTSAFSEDTFDANDWINAICQDEEAKQDKEAFVNNLISKIQTYIKQVNSSLEDTSQQVLTNLPLVIKDTKLLQMEAQTLKEKMYTINHDIDRVQSESGQCMAGLERLDKLKTSLESAKRSLLEADKWTTLVSDIEEIFEQGDVATVAERLEAMSSSLDTMGKHVDAGEKYTQLEEYRNRLEALASPLIVQAFSTGSIEQSRKMVRIFAGMNRLPQLLSYYRTYHKTDLAQRWREHVAAAAENGAGAGGAGSGGGTDAAAAVAPTAANITWLQDYYDLLTQHCREQMKWTAAVLSTTSQNSAQQSAEPPMTVVCDTLAELLPTLDPSPAAVLQKCLKSVAGTSAAGSDCGEDGKLTLLADAVACTRKFANSAAGLVNGQGNLPYETQLALATAAYCHLVPFVAQYPSFESTHLTARLGGLRGAQPDPADTVQNLALNNARVAQYCAAAAARCAAATLGCALPGLARIAEAFLISYCDQYAMAVRQLERRRTYEQDWNTFQMCVTLLQAAGDLHARVCELDAKICAQASSEHQKSYYNSGRGCGANNPFAEYKKLLLSKEEAGRFDGFVTDIENKMSADNKTASSDGLLFRSFYGKLKTACADLHKVLFDIVTGPVLVQIEGVGAAQAWCAKKNASGGGGGVSGGSGGSGVLAADLPDYSFSPQEYITQIGQYLLTLPQHLEPFLLQPSDNLMRALLMASASSSGNPDADGGTRVGYGNTRMAADVLLSLVAKRTCAAYAGALLQQIQRLGESASKQLAVDIEYLGSVLEELGLKSAMCDLNQWPALLRCPPDTYNQQQQQANSSGCQNPRLVTAIRQMRGIASTA